MAEEDYSEVIEFSENGIRMAVLEENGTFSHLDNWKLEMFGGALPNAGDHITTLWDPERPEPVESYVVLERHWVGELKGDNCWWLLLKAVQPKPEHRKLFKVAREQSAYMRQIQKQTYADLVEVREALLASKKAPAKSKPRARKPKPIRNGGS